MNGQPASSANGAVFSDDALRAAARLVCESMLGTLPPPGECEHEFSDSFNEKMAFLLRKDKKRRVCRRFAQRVAVILLAVVLGSGIWLSVDAEARASFVRWVREVYENSIIYRFFDDDADIEFPTYRLDVGDNYKIVHESEHASSYSVFYRDDESGESIFFEYVRGQDGTAIGILENKADYVNEKVQIGIIAGDFYHFAEKGSSNILIWVDEDIGIVFALNSTLDKDEIIALAESLIEE